MTATSTTTVTTPPRLPAGTRFPSLPGRQLLDLPDEELMRIYVDGEERAYRVLFDRYARALMGMVRRRVRSEDEALDIVQQTFLNVHRARAAFRADSRFKPWLYTICTNLVREHYRKLGRRKESLTDFNDRPWMLVDPSNFAADMQVVDEVHQALQHLMEGQREVIEMRWFQDKSYPEIAELLGATESAVRVRAHRGYKRLRGVLAAAA